MHAVIFEVLPEPERRQEYLDLAAALRPEVERIDGFLSVERFASVRDGGKLLSLSLWRDEAALSRWRRHARHRAAQAEGRAGIFRDYRIRVAEVVAALDGSSHGGPPARDDGAVGDPRPCVAVLEIEPPAGHRGGAAPGWELVETHQEDLVAWEGFESLYAEGKRLVLASWADGRGARAWAARLAASSGGDDGHRLRLMAVERDYGMFDRAGAPRPEPAASAHTATTT